MKISYAVTTHNEHKEIAELIPFILQHKDKEDELVIIDDHSDIKRGMFLTNTYMI